MAKRSEKTVPFLCTGKYYRSRFAEVLFNSVAGKMGLPWRASSRGLALERGVNNVGPMAASAVKALVVALEHAEHLPLLQERFPVWAEMLTGLPNNSSATFSWRLMFPGRSKSLLIEDQRLSRPTCAAFSSISRSEPTRGSTRTIFCATSSGRQRSSSER
jgi:protein-tyrosine phosphatase